MGPALSGHHAFSPGLPPYAQGPGFNLSDYPLQASPTYAHGSAKITASHGSWGSDHGPQCSHSSFGKVPRLQLTVLWLVSVWPFCQSQSNQRPPLPTSPSTAPSALQHKGLARQLSQLRHLTGRLSSVPQSPSGGRRSWVPMDCPLTSMGVLGPWCTPYTHTTPHPHTTHITNIYVYVHTHRHHKCKHQMLLKISWDYRDEPVVKVLCSSSGPKFKSSAHNHL